MRESVSRPDEPEARISLFSSVGRLGLSGATSLGGLLRFGASPPGRVPLASSRSLPRAILLPGLLLILAAGSGVCFPPNPLSSTARAGHSTDAPRPAPAAKPPLLFALRETRIGLAAGQTFHRCAGVLGS